MTQRKSPYNIPTLKITVQARQEELVDTAKLHTRVVRQFIRLNSKPEVNRMCFNQSQVDRTGLICHNGDDFGVSGRFRFYIVMWSPGENKKAYARSTNEACNRFTIDLSQLWYSCKADFRFVGCSNSHSYGTPLRAFEGRSIDLCHSLHFAIYKRLSIIPKRKRWSQYTVAQEYFRISQPS